METIIRQVQDMAPSERSALEQLIGHALRENQQLVIQVMSAELPSAVATSGALPAWCNLYEGLSDEQITDIEKPSSAGPTFPAPPSSIHDFSRQPRLRGEPRTASPSEKRRRPEPVQTKR
jgi:hypothetical protein